MDERLKEKMDDAIWAAQSLFNRCKTSGSSANLSFLHEGNIYISASGSCFGNMTYKDFAAVTMDGRQLSERKPSKELKLHRLYYEKDTGIQAIIHTHGTYSVLWSCLEFEERTDIIPQFTPYLKMKVGSIGLIPYAKPGTQKLFDLFKENRMNGDAYLLKNHGGMVGASCISDAFYGMEELEESTRIAWEIMKVNKKIEMI